MELVDDAYDAKMTAFEIDCNDGKGEPSACHHVGEFFSIVKDDHKRAFNVYELNCNKSGYSPSCFNLGKLYLGGRGVEQNDAAATSLFKKSCDGGHNSGCYHQALLMYLNATPKASPPAPSSSSSSSSATPVEGKSSVTPTTIPTPTTAQKKVQAEALKIMEKNCTANNDSESCYFAGSFFVKKDSEQRNPNKSIEYFTKSCSSNHAPSCFNLAVLYKNGDTGIKPNPELFEEYKIKTNELVARYGGIGGTKTG